MGQEYEDADAHREAQDTGKYPNGVRGMALSKLNSGQ
jgi:hypothetical protein